MAYKKLSPHIKSAWVKALRSGDYSQGCTYLRSAEDAYCCLGVLCDLGTLGEWKLDGNRYLYTSPVLESSSCLFSCNGEVGLPCALEAGLDTVIGLDSHAQDKLIRMNDDGTPFPEIADWIEENL